MLIKFDVHGSRNQSYLFFYSNQMSSTRGVLLSIFEVLKPTMVIELQVQLFDTSLMKQLKNLIFLSMQYNIVK